MALSSQSPSLLVLIRILLLACAYWITGWLSLQLAIPPGFVSGLFLPMGIALGAMLIWGVPMIGGVLLGSTLLNLSVSLLAGHSFSSVIFLIAFEIACGSALASLAGVLLIRRYVGFPNDLTDERKIFLLFVLGGPVATSVSASIGSLVLVFNGLIDERQWFYSWWTWWIGDAIGVLIAVPLMCVFFAEPRHFWRSRRATVGVPLVLSCAIVVVIFVMASVNEQKKIEVQFRQEASLVSAAVQSNLSSVEYVLATLSGLFIASDNVTREEFGLYVDHVIDKKRGISGFSWNRYLLSTERAPFEQQMIKEGFDGFYIKEKSDSDGFVVAPERADYVVVSYIEPWAANQSIHGLNIAIDPARADALKRALDANQFVMTQPLQLLQDNQHSAGVIAFYPVFKLSELGKNSIDRNMSLMGYATAIVRTTDLVEAALIPFKSGDYNLAIVDVTKASDPAPFYRKGQANTPVYARSLVLEDGIAVGGRQLSIRISPTDKFLNDHIGLQSWFVLAGGLLFCSLLGGFLLLISGRTQHIRNLVDQRTQELASILENAAEAILVVDESGAIQKANPAAASLFGYSLAELNYLYVADLVPSLQSGLVPSYCSSAPRKSQEEIARRSDGADLTVELSISLVNINERTFFTFIVHDVTARRKVDSLKAEFISTVSHELRTPLTSIKGALSIVLSGSAGQLDAKAQQLLSIAKNNADRLSRLVNDILDIDKLEFGNVRLNIMPLPIFPLLKQSIEQNQTYAERYGVRLQLDLCREELMLLAANVDSDRFLQVMSNLISNAIKFSHRGGEVRVCLDQDGDNILLSVVDSGQGIPAEFRQRIFTKFAQADSSDTRRRDGTGLGLSITKAIVERMGGSIDYVSVLNQGTTFMITLPLVPTLNTATERIDDLK